MCSSDLTLGYGLPRSQRGFPFPASKADGDAIMERVARLSRAMGTEVIIEAGHGVIRVK